MSVCQLPHDHGQTMERHLGRIPDAADFQAASALFKLLSDASRLRIFWLLCHCEECVVNLSAMMGMSSPAIAHHLRLLRDNRLLVSRRAGKEVYYRAADTPQAQALHHMIEDMVEISCPRPDMETDR